MNIQPYLPSKKIRIVLFVMALCVLLYVIFLLVQKHFFSQEAKEQLVTVSLVEEKLYTDEYLVLDSDGDGAYDWQEALWPELDPQNPDSDGDGVLDGRYIEIKNSLRDSDGEFSAAEESSLSETDKLGRSLYTALLAIEESGHSLDAETNSQISGNVASYISDLSFSKKIYTRDEFVLVGDTRENSYAYRDVMKKLLKQYPVATSDIELLIKATQAPAEYKGQLQTTHLRYKNYLGKLVELDLPYSIAAQHTRLVNIISKFEASFNNLLQDEIDELITLSSIVQLETILNNTTEVITKINLFFEIVENTNDFEIEIPDAEDI